MYPQKSQIQGKTGAKTYPLGEQGELLSDGRAMALVALSHTHLEHSIYMTMLSETSTRSVRLGFFSTRQLMTLTDIRPSEDHDRLRQLVHNSPGTQQGDEIWRHRKADGTNATIKEILNETAMGKRLPDYVKQIKKEAGVEILDEKLKLAETSASSPFPASRPAVKLPVKP